jgi:hypothetical protein
MTFSRQIFQPQMNADKNGSEPNADRKGKESNAQDDGSATVILTYLCILILIRSYPRSSAAKNRQ